MTRLYTDICNQDVRKLLETLANKGVNPDQYKETMTKIGDNLGNFLLTKINDKTSDIYLACTVEDADFLAKGILSELENHYHNIGFACFWNKRFSPFEIEDLKVAPILKKYQEPSHGKVQYLIVIKSIISGACVVRTNLVNLIQKIEPEKIFIVAPVIYKNAEQKLKDEFDENIYSKFEFLYFAKDDECTNEGEVIPGIGGNVYLRLGFDGQDNKNEYIPEIVKKRRSQFMRQKQEIHLSKNISN
ncbi:hypothetical protein [Cylindrospermopsis raciborskii]|uniref:hypothetical protein n=1 Tax=Cylindrospermopsis raciborskii TaxID=77022 RepID=UPI001BA92905|nr:hypothetical protein [Cylindrospermopsis raciborskii]